MVNKHELVWISINSSRALRRTLEELDVDLAIQKLINPPSWINVNIARQFDKFFPWIYLYRYDEIMQFGWIMVLLDNPSKMRMIDIESALDEDEAENFFQFLIDHGYTEFMALYLDVNRPQGNNEGSMRL